MKSLQVLLIISPVKTPGKTMRRFRWHLHEFPWTIISRHATLDDAKNNPPTEPGTYDLIYKSPGKWADILETTITIEEDK